MKIVEGVDEPTIVFKSNNAEKAELFKLNYFVREEERTFEVEFYQYLEGLHHTGILVTVGDEIYRFDFGNQSLEGRIIKSNEGFKYFDLDIVPVKDCDVCKSTCKRLGEVLKFTTNLDPLRFFLDSSDYNLLTNNCRAYCLRMLKRLPEGYKKEKAHIKKILDKVKFLPMDGCYTCEIREEDEGKGCCFS